MQLDDLAVVKKRRKKRMEDPTRAKAIPFVYVAWVWAPKFQRWFLLGFMRGSDRLTPRRIRKWRAKFTIPDVFIVRFRELFTAVAAPGDESDPEMMYEFKRHLDRARYAPDEKSLNRTFRPRPFAKRRPIEPSHARPANAKSS